jgi:hypothetical protein
MAVALKLQELNLAPEKSRRLEELRAAIREQSRSYDAATGVQREAVLDKLAGLRRDVLALMQEADRSTAKADGGPMATALALVPQGGAILAPLVTRAGGKILIVASNKGNQALTVVDVPGLTTEQVDKLMRGDGKVGASGGWLGSFNIQYLPEAEMTARIGEWNDAIEGIGHELRRLFAARLDRELQARGVERGARIVWLPTSALGLLPLGLARTDSGELPLGEKYEIVLAPSLKALATAAHQAAQAPASSLAAAVNPTGDLPFTETESALVAAHFSGKPQTLLGRSNASPEAVLAALKGKTYWHFSSHGFFDWSDARKAGLLMKDREPLSIGALLDVEGSLGRPRLVVLSACETGLYDTNRNPDEFVGLPATFMQLGATGVLGTLWQVSDLATAFLMAKFYDLHIGEGLSPPTALKRAQSWLRQAKTADLVAYARAIAARAKLAPDKLADLEAGLTAAHPRDAGPLRGHLEQTLEKKRRRRAARAGGIDASERT